MRLTQKKIEEILLDIIGGEGLPLVQQLYGKEHVSEFELATKTKKDIKLIRRMLYTLYNHNIISFIRKKDKQERDEQETLLDLYMHAIESAKPPAKAVAKAA